MRQVISLGAIIEVGVLVMVVLSWVVLFVV
jgi:hypothetical protein